MAETKQGLEVIVKFASGKSVSNSAGYVPGEYKPVNHAGAIAPDVTFTYKRSVDFNWNYNVRPIHNAQGVVQHYKGGIPSGTLTLSSLYMDEADFDKLREACDAIDIGSVPWGYMEIWYLGVDGAIEYALSCRRVVLSNRSISNPEDDSSVNFEFILFECPTKLASGAELLT